MHSATVVIATRNRKEDLRRAIRSALAQTERPHVLVMDDASSDGTREMVEAEFPEARLERSEKPLGYIHQRNRAAQMANSSIIFSIDDDAEFSTPRVIETTLQEFNSSLIGAVAIPVVDINRSPKVHGRAPSAQKVFATYSFIGTAHALRRDLFLRLSGYRTILVHQGEEEDYCLRMLDAGFITRCGNADPIHHFESPRRSWKRMDYFGARNKVLYAFQNVPFPQVIAHLAGTTLKTTLYTARPDRLWTRVRGVLAGHWLGCSGRAGRMPVRATVYHLSRELKSRGPMCLEQVETRLHEHSLPNEDYAPASPLRKV